MRPTPLALVLLASPLLAQAPLPQPTGPFPIGTMVAYLVDSARADQEYPQGRPTVLQLFYPAKKTHGTPARYLLEPGIATALLRDGYYDVDSASFRRWDTMTTAARRDVPPREGRHPLVLFMVGLGVLRANYTLFAEELASRGDVVALVDTPLEGMMFLPDGREISDVDGVLNEIPRHRAAVRDWVGDLRGVLDRLQSRRVAPQVAATIDWSRVAAAGHSTGGIVAIALAEGDARVRGAIDLDGGFASPAQEPLADFVATGLTKPALILRSHPLYSDADLAKRGLTRAQWEARGAGGLLASDSMLARSRAEVWSGNVAGTGHFSYSDAPWVMPTTISRFGGTIIDPARGREVIVATMVGYLDHLFDRGQGFSKLPSRYRELELTKVAPSSP